jgi:divalent metal cation (Fe/Co/Zn/Cd) transporter
LACVDPEVVDAAEASLAAQTARSVRMRWIGHHLHADAELDIDPTVSVDEAHRIAHMTPNTGAPDAVPKLDASLRVS